MATANTTRTSGTPDTTGTPGTPAWTIQPTPNPPGAQDSVLSEVSCPSSMSCMAVGHFTNRAGAGVALAERWDGVRWSIAQTSIPAKPTTSLLFDVSCPTRRMCLAVGGTSARAKATVPLAERWNGHGWALRRPGEPRPRFRGDVSYLGGVSCATTTDCSAVGYAGNSAGTRGAVLVERWHGGRWVIEPHPRVAGAIASFLSSVSCASPRSCIAVGFANRADGRAVSLAERWDGSRWTLTRTPNPRAGTTVKLSGVSCTSPRSCTAVGSFTIITGIEIMLAERWDGTRWTLEKTLYPAGARFVGLSGVSCISPTSCVAVGSFNNVAGIDVTLSESRAKDTWTIQLPPNPPDTLGAMLTGVSCRSTQPCTSVGAFTRADGTEVTLAERSS